jgi:hypothetical protein
MIVHSDHHHEPNGESSTLKQLIISCAVLLLFAIICFLIMFAGML